MFGPRRRERYDICLLDTCTIMYTHFNMSTMSNFVVTDFDRGFFTHVLGEWGNLTT